ERRSPPPARPLLSWIRPGRPRRKTGPPPLPRLRGARWQRGIAHFSGRGTSTWRRATQEFPGSRRPRRRCGGERIRLCFNRRRNLLRGSPTTSTRHPGEILLAFVGGFYPTTKPAVSVDHQAERSKHLRMHARTNGAPRRFPQLLELVVA